MLQGTARRIVIGILGAIAVYLLYRRRQDAALAKKKQSHGRSRSGSSSKKSAVVKDPPSQSTKTGATTSGSKMTAGKQKVRVDMVFLRRILDLLKVCIPTPFGIEGVTLSFLAVLLMARTRLTIMMAQAVGETARHLVTRNPRSFFGAVADIGLWSFPSAVVNTSIKYMTSQLEARFRRNLQLYLHDRYLSDTALYRAATTSDMDNPDHRLTQDVQAFCLELSEIFPQIFKPTVDCIIFVLALAQHGGILPPLGMILYYLLCGVVMRAVMPNFARLTAITAQREGDYRTVHSQIIQHAEEVAFYRGERTERINADKAIQSLVRHTLRVKELKSYTDFMDGLLIKYGATCVGYAVCSIGVFALKGKAETAEMTRVYVKSSQLYIPLAQAIGKLVLLHQKITALAGYTARVSELKEFLLECDRQHLDDDEDGKIIPAKESLQEVVAGVSEIGALNASPSAVRGVQAIRRADNIVFSNVTICAPGCTKSQPLIKNLTLVVQRNKHLMVMGNNGSGKSALLRSIIGLWPIADGLITRPCLDEITLVPQRTYLPRGTFRTQLIFPDTDEDAKEKKVSDAELMSLVNAVGLETVVEREGGLDSFKEWHEVLSGGERQRVAFCRLLYHRPSFGLIDEATSAVNPEFEPTMYEEALKRGITLITVSHKKSLEKYHHELLILDGEGGFTVRPIS